MKWKSTQIAVFLLLFFWVHYRIINKAGWSEFLLQGPMLPLIMAGYCFIVTCIIFSITLRLQVWYRARRARRQGAGKRGVPSIVPDSNCDVSSAAKAAPRGVRAL
jgi:hypothetical protein